VGWEGEGEEEGGGREEWDKIAPLTSTNFAETRQKIRRIILKLCKESAEMLNCQMFRKHFKNFLSASPNN